MTRQSYVNSFRLISQISNTVPITYYIHYSWTCIMKDLKNTCKKMDKKRLLNPPLVRVL